ncbi:MAG: PASTA domain-containing protein [Acidobacteria bacterium]|nr:PASTA domain-containing protein [Acidobacteriota bacterium]
MPKKKESQPSFHHRLLNAGKFTVLIGVLIAVGLFSAYVGMRIAVRGTEVEVPLILGKSVGEATQLLERVHLRHEVIGERFDPEISEGAVISQHPLPGGTMKTAGKVQLIVSLGEKENPVPDLKGTSLRVAHLMAREAGFEFGNISEISLAGIEEDHIVEQFPPPHSRDFLSPRIDILVSKGDFSRYLMPDVMGQSLNRVLLFFESNDFELGNIRYVDLANVSAGLVVKQFPEPGYVLTEADSINLEVSR